MYQVRRNGEVNDPLRHEFLYVTNFHVLDKSHIHTEDQRSLAGQYIVSYPIPNKDSRKILTASKDSGSESKALHLLENEFVEDHRKILKRELGVSEVPDISLCKSCGVKPDPDERYMTIQ